MIDINIEALERANKIVLMEPLHSTMTDCAHVGYDFPTDFEWGMVDLWVHEPTLVKDWVVYIRKGFGSYSTEACYKDEPPLRQQFQRVYDAWQEYKERNK